MVSNFFADFAWFYVLIIVLAVWDLTIKLVALWRAGRNNQRAWFICLGVFNTAGILPIIYLLINRNKAIKK
jgi:hypothetical protein